MGCLSREAKTHRGYWFPLLVFGIVVLAATPFYWQSIPSCRHPVCESVGTVSSFRLFNSGLEPSMFLFPQQNLAAFYWLSAIPVALALCYAYFRWRRPVIGRVRIWPTTIVCIALLVALSVPGIAPWLPVGIGLPGDLTVRGLVPLLVIGIGLAALAIAQRSLLLCAFAVVFIALALLANLYDISNKVSITSNFASEELPNIILPGVLLLLGAGFFWIVDWRKPLGGAAAPQ